MRKFIYLFLSVFLVFSSVTSSYAASSWSVTKSVSAGSRTVVSASKAGFKSAVNIAPTAGRLALKLRKGANWASLLYAAIQLAPDIADIESFQPDYSNNRVSYNIKKPAVRTYGVWGDVNSARASTPEEACKLHMIAHAAMFNTSSNVYKNPTVYGDYDTNNWKCYFQKYINGQFSDTIIRDGGTSTEEAIVKEYITIPAAAAQMIKNANSGHAPSQAATRETATEMVIGGQFDQDLLQGAVPTSDSTPLVPSVPISGNGNVTHGADVGIGEGGTTGATPGQQADAAIDAADAARKAAQAAADAAKAAAEDARKAADDAADLVNSGADQAAIDAANDRAAAAEQAAADAKAAADAAVAAANDRAAAAERAAESATQAAQAAADKAAADVAAAKAAGDAAAQAAAEAAKAAADAAVAAAKEKQAAAEKAAEKAKAEAAKPFELPAFCTWASIVCETAEWLKREPVIDESSGDIEVQKTDETMHVGILERLYIDMPAQCPADPLLEFMGAKIPFPMSVFCQFASMMKPLILLFAYIKGLSIIGNGLT